MFIDDMIEEENAGKKKQSRGNGPRPLELINTDYDQIQAESVIRKVKPMMLTFLIF